MPGMALRIAASITVAPFSTSTLRVAPVWSTKLILAMCARTAEWRVGVSYNGSPRSALVQQMRRSGRPEHVLDRAPRLGNRAAKLGQCAGRIALADRLLQRLRGVGD